MVGRSKPHFGGWPPNRPVFQGFFRLAAYCVIDFATPTPPMHEADARYIAPPDNKRSPMRDSKLMGITKTLEVGQTLFVSFQEWAKTGLKTSPFLLIQTSCYHPRASLRGRRFVVRKCDSGWYITRRQV